MIKVKRIVSGVWQEDRRSIEDKINSFFEEIEAKYDATITDIKMDFGGPDRDYIAAYIFYKTGK